jgi:hypothetical protein
MTTAAPQHMRALADANVIRVGQANLKKELAAMPRNEALDHAAYLLENPNDWVGRMNLRALLVAIPRVGQANALRFMQEAGVHTGALSRRIAIPRSTRAGIHYAPLSERARRDIAAVLRHAARR